MTDEWKRLAALASSGDLDAAVQLGELARRQGGGVDIAQGTYLTLDEVRMVSDSMESYPLDEWRMGDHLGTHCDQPGCEHHKNHPERSGSLQHSEDCPRKLLEDRLEAIAYPPRRGEGSAGQ